MQAAFEKIIEKLEERTSFLSDCTKYGNNNAEQQEKSYSTMMMYEVADLVDDLIEIVKQEAEKYKDLDIEFAKKCVELSEKMNVCDLVAENCRLSNENRFLKLSDCNNGWIPCSSGRLPEENTDVEVTIEEIANDVGGKRYYNVRSWLQDGQWVIKKNPYNPTVIAWKYPTEPYQPKGE